LKPLLFIAFVATVVCANWALRTYGFVPVGFGLMAPAGVYFAGLAFTLRDLLHEAGGRRWVIAAIVVGAMLSFGIEDAQRIAIPSGIAFGLSELADLLVYSPLRQRNWLGAVLASNTVGLFIDSALFLWIAFGSLAFIEGQLLGKAYMTLLAIAVLWMGRRALPIRGY
jgi:uncharacterized PurR-regulated membrane protein YhhQ (DUF165 family)